MPDTGSSSSNLPIPALLLVMMSLIGLLTNDPTLDSLRPKAIPVERLPPEWTDLDEETDARLWEDPFEVVQRITDRASIPEEGNVLKPSVHGEITPNKKHGKTLILPVMVNSSHYAEDKERRLQRRYALISGLNVAGFRPAKANTLGLTKLPIPKSSLLDPNPYEVQQIAVPFEWYSREPISPSALRQREIKSDWEAPDFKVPKEANVTDYDSVLVLWLDNNYFQSEPLHKLQSLYEWFEEPAYSDIEKTERSAKSWYMKVLGPGDSSVIQELMIEMKKREQAITVLYTEVGSEISNLEVQITALGKTIITNTGEISKKEEQQEVAQAEMENFQKDLDDLNKTKKQFDEEGVEPLKSRIATLESDKTQLQSTLEEDAALDEIRAFAESEISNIQIERNTAYYKLNQLDVQLDDLYDKEAESHYNLALLQDYLKEYQSLTSQLAKNQDALVSTRKEALARQNQWELGRNNWGQQFIQSQELLQIEGTNGGESSGASYKEVKDKEDDYVDATFKLEALQKENANLVNAVETFFINFKNNYPEAKIERSGLESSLNFSITKAKAELDLISENRSETESEVDSLSSDLEFLEQRETSIIGSLEFYRNEKLVLTDRERLKTKSSEIDSNLESIQQELDYRNLFHETFAGSQDQLVNSIDESEQKIMELENKIADSKAETEEAETEKEKKEAIKTNAKKRFEVLEKRRLGSDTFQVDYAFEIISPFATANFIYLEASQNSVLAAGKSSISFKELKARDKQGRESDQLKAIRDSILNRFGVLFSRNIHLDNEVVKSLLEELDRRGVNLAKGNNPEPMVLIGEWDTLYSRSLMVSFAVEYSHIMSGKNSANSDSWPEDVYFFSYMRGIDGKRPGSNSTAEDGSSGSKSKDDNEFLETSTLSGKSSARAPVGESQYDYLRRLAARIQELDADKRRKGEKGVRAIGILGSDVYDKLLILRALRKDLPNTLFFTTDLDARLSYPPELPWSRNLIVGSSYGLQLDESIQAHVPPFRNSYQTSLFTATLLATGQINKRFQIEDFSPRIFEIGNKGPYDLTPPQKDHSLHPGRTEDTDDAVFIAAIPFGFMILLILIFTFFGFQRHSSLNSWTAGKFLYATTSLFGVGVLGVLIILGYNNGEGEPFDLSAGISVWPTEIIRYVVVIISFFFILRLHQNLAIDGKTLPEKYGFSSDNNKRENQPLLKRVKQSLGRLISSFFWPIFPSNKDAQSVEDLWRTYNIEGKKTFFAILLVLISVAYMLTGKAFIEKLGPFLAPARGGIALKTDLVFLLISLAAMISLTLMVAYYSLRCSHIIKHLYIRSMGTLESRFWPEGAFPDKVQGEMRGIYKHGLNVSLASRISQTIGVLIIPPYLAFFFMILSRDRFFDNWNWTIPLIIVVLFTLSIATLTAMKMRFDADQTRKAALNCLRNLQMEMQIEESAKREKLVGLIESTIGYIERTQRGAFSSAANNPVLLAFLTPFGGIGTIQLLQFIATRGA